MDKKSKILFIIMGLLIIGSVAVTYWRIMVKKDYIIEAQTDCDPYTENCFIWECDPNSTEEGEACTGDPESDIWYYKITKRNAANIPLCDPETDETCDPWACGLIESECSQTLCDEITAEEQGVECNDPEQYTLDNPEEEDLSADEEECDPEVDENCELTEECDPEVDEDCESGDEAVPDESAEEGEVSDESSGETE